MNFENINFQQIINNTNNYNIIYNGKVRNIRDINEHLLLLTTTNKLSAFDKHICNINNKGSMLNNITSWWFNKTKHIIENHYLFHTNEHMIVKKTVPIKIEFVVRAYITGETNTSLWTLYNNGARNINDIQLRDNYKKNEQLDDIIITPTTKGIKDIPISKKEIISNNYLTEEECNYIYKISLELFKYSQNILNNKGIILVDTKYEFGRLNDKIILIDEIHTCDSSRLWLKNSYYNSFINGIEPKKIDKDVIRDWIKTKCNPYKDNIPDIPYDLIQQTEYVYNLYNSLLNE